MPDKPNPSVKIQVTDGALIPSRGEKGLFSSWRIAFFGALVLLTLLPLVNSVQVQKPLSTFFAQFENGTPGEASATLGQIEKGTYVNHYWEIITFVPDGLIVTFQVTIFSILAAVVIGLIAGLGQISRNKTLQRISTVYVEVIRGIPLVVQIFYVYYSLNQLLKLSGIPAAVIAMAICYGAYMAEIFRAGIQAIPKGQMEASLALGMSRSHALIHVIIPQTIRIVIPAIGNEFIALLKDSSLVSMLALTDLMQRGRQYATRTFNYFETFTIVALIYLVMTLFLSRIVAWLEERMQSHSR